MTRQAHSLTNATLNTDDGVAWQILLQDTPRLRGVLGEILELLHKGRGVSESALLFIETDTLPKLQNISTAMPHTQQIQRAVATFERVLQHGDHLAAILDSKLSTLFGGPR